MWDDVIVDWVEDPKQRYDTDGGAQLPIEPFKSTAERVSITDILVHAIGKSVDRLTQADRNSVQKCLGHNGWERRQAKRGPDRGKWFYVRQGSEVRF